MLPTFSFEHAFVTQHHTHAMDSLPPPPPPSDTAPPPPSTSLPPPPPPPSTEAILYDGPELQPEPVAKREKKGWGSKPKSNPLSIEEILAKKKAADELAAKVSQFQPIPAHTVQMFTSSLQRLPFTADLVLV